MYRNALFHRSLDAAVVVFSLLGVACGGRERASVDTTARRSDSAPPSPSASAPPTRTPPVVGGNLGQLRWIEGTWRGTGVTQPPFYERYRLVDDSTLVVEGFPDSTIAAANDVTRFRLRGGILTSAPGASGEPTAQTPRYVASTLSSDSVRFEPLVGVQNSFVWRRGTTANDWVAVLSWPATAQRAARQVTYTMRRWR